MRSSGWAEMLSRLSRGISVHMTRFVCIHGHFYQPPREDPWWEEIEVQPSAAPFRDWNERITAECYGPNAWARILHDSGAIDQVVNNYSRISFNFGPTLLSWLEQHQPKVYEAILEADVESRGRFSGHGSAIAQTFNHMILPLANRRDKETQIHWGIEDFLHRFGRAPEGMWLAETAVDLESLDLMAQAGIGYTILAPSQARCIRAIGEDHWHDVSHGRVDPTRPYEVRLPSGNSMAVFFYDGPISRAVAFERLLENGERLVHRLMSAFAAERDWNPLVHISTDGETYGHHHSRGEMALAYALQTLEHDPSVRLTNYGEYLDEHPPQLEAEIWENSSWSCVHGVQRWCADCGCSSGLNPGFHQGWRGPYRDALNWLRDLLAVEYTDAARQYLKEPWSARNRYVDVVLDRDDRTRREFLERERRYKLNPEEEVCVWKLLEMQRQSMLMYTSCGWFFDEVSGLETVQTMRYAARAIELSRELFGTDHETGFLCRLEAAPSNLDKYSSGRDVYQQEVIAKRAGCDQLAAEYTVRKGLRGSLVSQHGRQAFEFAEQNWRRVESENRAASGGRLTLTSLTTREIHRFDCVTVQSGHEVICNVRLSKRESEDAVSEWMTRLDDPGLSVSDVLHSADSVSLESFNDVLRSDLLRMLSAQQWQADQEQLRELFQRHRSVVGELITGGLEIPSVFLGMAESVLGLDLQKLVTSPVLSASELAELVREAQCLGVKLDAGECRPILERSLEMLCDRWIDDPGNEVLRSELKTLAGCLPAGMPDVDLTHVQNRIAALRQRSLVSVELESTLIPVAREVDELARLSGIWWPELMELVAESERALV